MTDAADRINRILNAVPVEDEAPTATRGRTPEVKFFPETHVLKLKWDESCVQRRIDLDDDWNLLRVEDSYAGSTGNVQKTREYYPNGVKKSETTYENGAVKGYKWNEDGVLEEEIESVCNGDTKTRFYDDKGQVISSETHDVQGLQDGIQWTAVGDEWIVERYEHSYPRKEVVKSRDQLKKEDLIVLKEFKAFAKEVEEKPLRDAKAILEAAGYAVTKLEPTPL